METVSEKDYKGIRGLKTQMDYRLDMLQKQINSMQIELNELLQSQREKCKNNTNPVYLLSVLLDQKIVDYYRYIEQGNRQEEALMS